MLTFHVVTERCHSPCRILENLEAVMTVHYCGTEQIPVNLLEQTQAIK